MSRKPIVLLAHPRSCSTAFERMFLTQPQDITCIHEPFCDAYHFGPERLSERYTEEQIAQEKVYEGSTYKVVLDKIWSTDSERVFIKDMAKSLVPPLGKPVSVLVPPSLSLYQEETESCQGVIDNPSVIPRKLLERLHFTFLIRHPCLSIPSLYGISTPPGSNVTGWHGFHSDDCGFLEMRKLFDYLKNTGLIGPHVAGSPRPLGGNGENGRGKLEICIVDAEELLADPPGVCEAYCRSVGTPFDASMLQWSSAADHKRAKETFEKSWAQHVDALQSQTFRAGNPDVTRMSAEQQDELWTERFGGEGAKIIREHVERNLLHYEYLKQFAIKRRTAEI